MNPRAIRHVILAGDLVWIIFSAVAAYMLRTGSALTAPSLNVAFRESMFLMTAAGIAWVFVFHRMKLDGFYGGYDASAVLSQLFTGVVTLVVLIACAGFLLREESSRMLLLTFSLLFFVLAFAGRNAARAVARRFSGAGKRHRVLVMGKGRIAQELAWRIQKHPEMRWEVVGFLFPTAGDFVEPVLHEQSSQLNSLQIESLLKNNGVDELILTSPVPDQGEMLNLIANCRHRGIRVSVVPNLYQLYVTRPALLDLDGLPLLRLGEGQPTPVESLLKRAVDLALGSALFIVCLPVLTVSALMLWMNKGKALVHEMRCGCNGRTFRMYRFNIDRAAKDLKGMERLLFMSSFSELPQLINVLRGDMSLVGPRPEPVERVKRYSDWQRQRLNCKPGVTGLAQVHGLREENSSEAKAYYDLRYIQDWSLLADLSLMLQTLWTIVRRFPLEAHASFERGASLPENSNEFTELAHADRS
ncbi:MAG TPA: sugar transferase [Candidatus Limnocylindrales bacterium]|nr:sugar transferase [Candidatus Limnocylindrales bacterium]